MKEQRSEQIEVRLRKLADIENMGVSAYPSGYKPTHTTGQVRKMAEEHPPVEDPGDDHYLPLGDVSIAGRGEVDFEARKNDERIFPIVFTQRLHHRFPAGLQLGKTLDMKIDNVLNFFRWLRHVGPMSVPGYADKVQALLCIAQCLFQ